MLIGECTALACTIAFSLQSTVSDARMPDVGMALLRCFIFSTAIVTTRIFHVALKREQDERIRVYILLSRQIDEVETTLSGCTENGSLGRSRQAE